MIKVKDLIEKIEKFAPIELAYEWDNSGLIVGDKDKEVKRVYITLDLFKENIDEAVDNNVDFIVSHHPILFKGIKKVDYNSQQGYVLRKLIENNIALYVAHTNMDCARGGINDVLAKKLGLKNTWVMEKSDLYENCGLGRIGFLDKETTLEEYAKEVKKELNTPFVRICGDFERKIKKVVVGGGACDDLIEDAIKLNADVIVTADMKYHISAESVDNGLAVIDAGHFPTEVFVKDIFEDIIKNKDLKIVKSTGKDVFKII